MAQLIGSIVSALVGALGIWFVQRSTAQRRRFEDIEAMRPVIELAEGIDREHLEKYRRQRIHLLALSLTAKAQARRDLRFGLPAFILGMGILFAPAVSELVGDPTRIFVGGLVAVLLTIAAAAATGFWSVADELREVKREKEREEQERQKRNLVDPHHA